MTCSVEILKVDSFQDLSYTTLMGKIVYRHQLYEINSGSQKFFVNRIPESGQIKVERCGIEISAHTILTDSQKTADNVGFGILFGFIFLFVAGMLWMNHHIDKKHERRGYK